MKFIFFLFLSLANFASQAQTPINKKALDFNNRAIKVMQGQGTLINRVDKSNQLLDSAITLAPTYIIAHQNKLNNLITIKNYDKALEVSDAILKLNPSIEIGTAKAALLHKKGKVSESKKSLSESIAQAYEKYKSKPSSNLLCNIAVAYFLNGEKQKALNLLATEKTKFSKKERLQIDGIGQQLPSFTFDVILNTHKAKFKPSFVRKLAI